MSAYPELTPTAGRYARHPGGAQRLRPWRRRPRGFAAGRSAEGRTRAAGSRPLISRGSGEYGGGNVSTRNSTAVPENRHGGSLRVNRNIR